MDEGYIWEEKLVGWMKVISGRRNQSRMDEGYIWEENLVGGRKNIFDRRHQLDGARTYLVAKTRVGWKKTCQELETNRMKGGKPIVEETSRIWREERPWQKKLVGWREERPWQEKLVGWREEIPWQEKLVLVIFVFDKLAQSQV